LQKNENHQCPNSQSMQEIHKHKNELIEEKFGHRYQKHMQKRRLKPKYNIRQKNGKNHKRSKEHKTSSEVPHQT